MTDLSRLNTFSQVLTEFPQHAKLIMCPLEVNFPSTLPLMKVRLLPNFLDYKIKLNLFEEEILFVIMENIIETFHTFKWILPFSFSHLTGKA